MAKIREATKRGGYKSRNVVDNSQLGKLPPQATDLEEAVLGALMLEKDALNAVIDLLKPESFYKESHKEIFQAIVDLFTENEPIDILSVTSQLRKSGKIEMIGGPYYITQLTNRVSSAANIEFHSRIIVEQSIKRELIRISSEIQKDAYEDTTDVFKLMDQMGESLMAVHIGTSSKRPRISKDVLAQLMAEISERSKSTSEITGVPSGIPSIDGVTSGWQRSDLIIIAARPAMGKTAFVLTIIRHAAIILGLPVAIFSLEMKDTQLMGRLASAESEINGKKVQKGRLEEHEWASLVHKTAKLSKAPIFIDDTPALSIIELRAKARRLKAQNDIQLIIVDYLQLMSGVDSNTQYGSNREQEISKISRSLKELAKELDVPVIALSQLSRAVESRGGDKRPQLSDLRESGAIEQDADMVSFLYRPEYYGITQDEAGMPTKGYAEFIIKKHRNGDLVDAPMGFIPEFTKFLDLQDLNAQQGSSQFPGGGNWQPTKVDW
ncbi:MAG: replicative DNA helicase [Roseivirga sp.]|nr:replicative DNA helicase [Roseivirga sp.]